MDVPGALISSELHNIVVVVAFGIFSLSPNIFFPLQSELR